MQDFINRDRNSRSAIARPLFGSLILLATLSLLIHLAAITHGSFELIDSELLGAAYDSLGKHLLWGSVEVDGNAIGWEQFIKDGKVFMYFGPFPALLRIPLNFIVPENYGRWSRFSCFLSSIMFVVAFVSLARRGLLANTELTSAVRRFAFSVSCLLVVWGSPYLHLVSSAQLYHEPILWGLAFAIAGIYFLNEILYAGQFKKRDYLLLSLCAGGALLSRVTFGVPLYLALAILAIYHLWQSRKAGKGAASLQIFLSLSPAILALLFQLWYNFERFGSPLTFFDMTRYVHWHTMQHLHPSGFIFGLQYLPDTLWNYILRPSGYFHDAALFVEFAHAVTARTYLYNSGYLQPTLSLVIASPALLMSFLLGVICMLKKIEVKAFLIALCFLFEGLLILAYPFMVQRYILEFFPLLIFVTVFLLRTVKVPTRTSIKIGCITLISLLCLWSIGINTVAALSWMTSAPAIPTDVQNRVKQLFVAEVSPIRQ